MKKLLVGMTTALMMIGSTSAFAQETELVGQLIDSSSESGEIVAVDISNSMESLIFDENFSIDLNNPDTASDELMSRLIGSRKVNIEYITIHPVFYYAPMGGHTYDGRVGISFTVDPSVLSATGTLTKSQQISLINQINTMYGVDVDAWVFHTGIYTEAYQVNGYSYNKYTSDGKSNSIYFNMTNGATNNLQVLSLVDEYNDFNIGVYGTLNYSVKSGTSAPTNVNTGIRALIKIENLL